MKLNCDLGESFGPWSMGADELVMPHIDMANIACGGHAGDPKTMLDTLILAKQNGTEIGAHPGYPDKLGFGRKSIPFEKSELVAHIITQVAALQGLAVSIGTSLTYVKPHGALYNDMMKNQEIREAVFEATCRLSQLIPNLKLMLQSTLANDVNLKQAQPYGISLIFEAFADRQYDDQGFLVARSQPGAVLSQKDMFEQIQLLTEGKVKTVSSTFLPLQVDSLCVHGDNPEAVAQIVKIKAQLESLTT